MKSEDIRKSLTEKGLKITPQRLAVLDAVIEIGNHPTADKITEFIKRNHPNIAVGTIYKTLETFVEKELIKKVKTDKDFMRYDAILEKHHHLYCAKSDRIEDYYDEELNKLLQRYFKNKKLDNFTIEDVKLQIVGTFINK